MVLCSGGPPHLSSDMDKDEPDTANPATTNSAPSPLGQLSPAPPPSSPLSPTGQRTSIDPASQNIYTTTIKFPTSHKTHQHGTGHPQVLTTISTSPTFPAGSQDTQPKFRIKEEDPHDIIDLTGLDDSDLFESDVDNNRPVHSESDSAPTLTPAKQRSQHYNVVYPKPAPGFSSRFKVTGPSIPLDPRRLPASIPSSTASSSSPYGPSPTSFYPQTPLSARLHPPSASTPSNLRASYQQKNQAEGDTRLPTTATISVCSCPIEVKVKRPSNSWITFRAAHHSSVKEQYPNATVAEVSKHISVLWNKLTDEGRKHWKDIAEKDKEQHRLSNPEYKYTPKKALRNGKLFIEFCEKCGLPTVETAIMSGGRLQTAAERGSAPSLNEEQQFRKQPPTFAVKMPGQMPRQAPIPPALLRKGEASSQQIAHTYSGLPTPTRLSLQAAPAHRPSSSGPARSVAEFRRVTQARRADSRGDIVQQTAHVPGPSDSALTLPYASVAPDSPLRPRSLWEHQQLAQLPRDATPAEIQKALQQMREMYGTAVRQSVAQQYTPARFPPATPRYAAQPNSARIQPPATPIASTPATGRALRPELIQPMEISALQRIKSIARIAGPRGLSCEDSLQRMRGVVIAIEGTDIQAVSLMARFLRTKFADPSRYAVSEWTPGFAEQLIAHASPQIKDMRRMIDLWDEAGEEILAFFVDPLNGNDAEEPTAPNTPRKRKSKALDDMDDDADAVLPVAILTQYMLTMTDVGSTTISPNDKYSPIEHYQWLASQWRGMIGPDITIYIDSPEDVPSRRASSADEMRAAAVALEGMHEHNEPMEKEHTHTQKPKPGESTRRSISLPSLQTVLDENAKDDLSPHLPPMSIDKARPDDADAMDEDPVPAPEDPRPRGKSAQHADATVETRLDDARSVILHLSRAHAVPERELHRVAFEIEDWVRGRLGRLGW